MPKAKRLEELGVELVEGDLDQLDTVRKGLSGTYRFFASLTWKERGPSRKIWQGRNLAEAAYA